ncbi:hypothetical protein ACFL4P_02530 [Gemmatimonadota bacterium]
MIEKYSLSEMLKEIKEDEQKDSAGNEKISQDEITKMLKQREQED